MAADSSFPRWSLALCAGLVAIVLAWAATMLPWREWTTFAVVTSIVAALHAVTAALALLQHPARGLAWRVQAIAALSYLVWITWHMVTASSYVAVLYGGLGEGVAAGLAAAWAVLAFVLLPVSVWGLAVTGGVRWGKSARIGTAAAAVLAMVGFYRAADRPLADDAVGADWTREKLGLAVASQLPEPSTLKALPDDAPSLMTDLPVRCATPPGPGVASVVATFLADDPDTGRPRSTSLCAQGPGLTEALRELDAHLRTHAYRGPIKVDVITGTQPMSSVLPVLDAFLLRPALDGVCEGGVCLMPWQLVALAHFRANMPIKVVPDLKFGFSPGRVRMALAMPERPERTSDEVDGLVRIETASFVSDDEGRLHRLHANREDDPPLDAAQLDVAWRRAEDYIAAAVGADGRFLYVINPYTGNASYNGFSLARQAGTSLVLCELAKDRERAREAARRALAMLASTERVVGDLGMLGYPVDKPIDRVDLGNTALSTIAFLTCRDLVGDEFDPVIDRLTSFLLAMQKEDGGFYPAFDLRTEAPVPGPDPLYAVGQAVYGLSLLERLVTVEHHPELAEKARVREAVERSMTYIAERYWNNFLTDFFYMEENWHCLAARASLGHHRHEGYERFCIDYVRYKSRLLFDEESGVSPELLGGWGFSNVMPAHNTGTAGFGEALAAAMAVKEVRGESDPEDERRMKLALRFLLRQQHDEVNCFACTKERSMVGGMGEHAGSPFIRIDYVQHAWAAMGHGGRLLGLAEGSSIPEAI
jgi:hypothetical protein